MIHPKIRDSVLVYHKDGTAQFVSLSDLWVKEFAVEPQALDLVRLLDGSRDVATVKALLAERHSTTAAEADELLDVLDAEGILDPSPVQDADDRWHRQRLFLHELGLSSGCGTGASIQDRISAAHVVVLGVGGAGSWLVQSLASAGVARLLLIDPDTVALSNLNRQVLFHESDVGQAKVDALARRVRQINSHVEVATRLAVVTSAVDLAELVHGADLVVNCADKPTVAVMSTAVSQACLPVGVNHIVGGAYGANLGVPGLSVQPRRTPCWGCATASAETSHGRSDHEVVKAGATAIGNIAPVTGLVGNLIAWESLRLLGGLPPAFAGQLREFDIRSLEWRSIPVVPQPECPYCASLRSTREAGDA